jgi:DNA-binding MarR family transcriptional regulator
LITARPRTGETTQLSEPFGFAQDELQSKRRICLKSRFRLRSTLLRFHSSLTLLQRLTGLTWGNLSAHISKLADAGYLKIEKSIVNKKTHTVAALTAEGREAFEEYRQKMLEVLDTE